MTNSNFMKRLATTAGNTQLAADYRAELKRCEAIIEQGLDTFVEVGSALLEIRDKRLYRDTHSTFESYCRERWQMDRTYAHRVIDASKVAENLLPIGNKPTHESQVRPLSTLEPEEQRSVWSQAVAESNGRQPTAAKVAEVVHVQIRRPVKKRVSQTGRATGPATRSTKHKCEEEEECKYEIPTSDGEPEIVDNDELSIYLLCMAIKFIASKTMFESDAAFFRFDGPVPEPESDRIIYLGYTPKEMVTLGRERFSRMSPYALGAMAQKAAAWLTAVAEEAGK